MSPMRDLAAERLVEEFIDLAWNRGDESAAALLGAGFAHHDLVTHAESDAHGYLRSILTIRAAFQAMEWCLDDCFGVDGRVATRWRAIASHPDAAEAVVIHGLSIDRVVGGRIVENWTAWDRVGLDEKLPGLLSRDRI